MPLTQPTRASCSAILAALSLLLSGCGHRESSAIVSAEEDAPATLEQASAAAKAEPDSSAEVKNLLDQALANVKAKHYPQAMILLQILQHRRDLTPEQRNSVNRAMVAVNKALAEKADSGSAQAQKARQIYRATK